MTERDVAVQPSFYPCGGCGARVEYAPGTAVLRCPYCGFEQQVAASGREVQEHAYTERFASGKPVASIAAHVLVCQKCGAQTESDALSLRCQFCATPMVVDATLGQQIAPEAVMPFTVDRAGVRTALRKWVSSRWFAPSQLKKVTEAETISGTYVPHWTFDTRTVSEYTGQRGEHYYVTETYTETVNGQSQTRTRQVRKTRWYPAAGEVRRTFDDVLVPATERLTAAQLDKLGPWTLSQAVAYQPEYLAGYQALRYEVEPEQGLDRAKAKMAPAIHEDCRRDIGGNEQRVHRVDTSYLDITFKLMLLPIWIATYLYGGRSWQVMVNARSGEVIGQRPYSAMKIAAVVILVLAVVAGLITWYLQARN